MNERAGTYRRIVEYVGNLNPDVRAVLKPALQIMQKGGLYALPDFDPILFLKAAYEIQRAQKGFIEGGITKDQLYDLARIYGINALIQDKTAQERINILDGLLDTANFIRTPTKSFLNAVLASWSELKASDPKAQMPEHWRAYIAAHVGEPSFRAWLYGVPERTTLTSIIPLSEFDPNKRTIEWIVSEDATRISDNGELIALSYDELIKETVISPVAQNSNVVRKREHQYGFSRKDNAFTTVELVSSRILGISDNAQWMVIENPNDRGMQLLLLHSGASSPFYGAPPYRILPPVRAAVFPVINVFFHHTHPRPAFSPDSSLLAYMDGHYEIGGMKEWQPAHDWQMTIYDLAKRAPVKQIPTGNADNRILVFSPDGTKIVGVSGTVLNVWDTQGTSQDALYTYTAPQLQSSPSLLSFAPTKNTIVACTFLQKTGNIISVNTDGNMLVHDIDTGGIARSVSLVKGLVRKAVFSPDGTRVACIARGDETQVLIYDTETGSKISTVNASDATSASAREFLNIRISHDNAYLTGEIAVKSADIRPERIPVLYSLETGSVLRAGKPRKGAQSLTQKLGGLFTSATPQNIPGGEDEAYYLISPTSKELYIFLSDGRGSIVTPENPLNSQ